jgi:hypothetical protein
MDSKGDGTRQTTMDMNPSCGPFIVFVQAQQHGKCGRAREISIPCASMQPSDSMCNPASNGDKGPLLRVLAERSWLPVAT